MTLYPGFLLGPLVSKVVKLALEPVTVPLVMITSGAFLYPFQGFIYFMCHPILWPYVLTVLVPQFILMSMIYICVMSLMGPPLIIVAIFFNGPTGIFTGILAVLTQASLFSTKITQWLVLPTPTKMLFDAA